jgi:Holliday junction resolvase RusA-like endonuclease
VSAPEILNFVAFGLPSPGGSKSAFRNPRTGKIVVVDAGGKKTRTWRTVVAHAARAAMAGGELMQPPLALIIEFRMPRPKAHYKASGEIKQDAPWFPIVRPDLTKLLRSTEDAMTGIVWHDDAQIVEQNIHRSYASDDGTGARITVYSISWRSSAAKTSTRMQEWSEGTQSFYAIDAHDKARSAVACKASAPVHS